MTVSWRRFEAGLWFVDIRCLRFRQLLAVPVLRDRQSLVQAGHQAQHLRLVIGVAKTVQLLLARKSSLRFIFNLNIPSRGPIYSCIVLVLVPILSLARNEFSTTGPNPIKTLSVSIYLRWNLSILIGSLSHVRIFNQEECFNSSKE